MKKILSIMFVFIAIFSLSIIRTTATYAQVVVEICDDLIDNDEDGFMDTNDSDCSAPAPIPAPVAEICDDLIDNDEDGFMDTNDSDCPPPAPAPVAEVCDDLIDNDEDGFMDTNDSDCVVAPAPILENTAELCSDKIDNDEDGFMDTNDSDCSAFLPQPAPTSTTPVVPATTNTGGQTGGSGTSGGGATFSGITNTPSATIGSQSTGTVLGASTDDAGVCSDMLLTYMRRGKKNDSAEVKKLQAFLNSEMKSNLPITGFFGVKTEAVVKAFQLKYADEILAPWVSVGRLSNANIATGYVYKTTLRKINILRCAGVNSPITIPQIPTSELI